MSTGGFIEDTLECLWAFSFHNEFIYNKFTVYGDTSDVNGLIGFECFSLEGLNALQLSAHTSKPLDQNAFQLVLVTHCLHTQCVCV